MRSSNTAVTFIPYGFWEERSRFLKPAAVLDTLGPDDPTVFCTLLPRIQVHALIYETAQVVMWFRTNIETTTDSHQACSCRMRETFLCIEKLRSLFHVFFRLNSHS